MKIMSFNTQHCQNYLTKKIDYIFVSRDTEVMSFEADSFIASDHFPIVAEIN